MPYYAEVITPNDSAFFGPFETHEACAAWCEVYLRGRLDTHDAYLLTEAEMRKSIETYGPAPILPPEH